MNITRNKLVCIALMACSLSAPSFATITKFLLVPTTPTVVTVPANRAALVQYTVTNQTKTTRTLTMVPVQGITQVTGQTGYCSNPFTLGSQDSCLLTVSLDGSQMQSGVLNGPQVCKTINGTNQPDSLLCSEPSKAYALSVTVTQAVPNTNQAVYVTNWNANSISLCSANASTGALENCNITAMGGTLSKPEAIAMNSSATLLYVANIGGSVSLCSINSQTGALSGCHTTGSGFSGPDGVVINSAGTQAYISNAANPEVSLCQISASTGELSSCRPTGSGFSVQSDIAINPTVNPEPLLGGCVATSEFSGPEGVALNASGSHAYVTNNTDNTITLCSFDGDGVLTGCETTGGTFTGFGNLAFNSTGRLAYVPSSRSSVSVCSVDQNTGGLSACVDSTGTGFSGPSGVLLVTLP